MKLCNFSNETSVYWLINRDFKCYILVEINFSYDNNDLFSLICEQLNA
jgi:hypothetical protein